LVEEGSIGEVMADLIVEVIGWSGMLLILIAYFLITMKKVERDSKLYHGMNLLGSITLGYNTLVNMAYPSTFLNVMWILIAIYGLTQGFKK
jgi:hypothetical protein